MAGIGWIVPFDAEFLGGAGAGIATCVRSLLATGRMASDSPPENQPDETTQFAVMVFTDICDSTALKAEHGALEYRKVAELHNRLFEWIAGEERLTLIKNTGDGYFARTTSVAAAVRFALRFQDGMRRMDWPGFPITTRVGIHAGEVVDITTLGQADVLAPAADLVARVMGLAVGGQILLTRGPFDEARHFIRAHPAQENGAVPELTWMAHGHYYFKGCAEPVEVFEVGATGLAPLSAPPDGEKARRAIYHGGDAKTDPPDSDVARPPDAQTVATPKPKRSRLMLRLFAVLAAAAATAGLIHFAPWKRNAGSSLPILSSAGWTNLIAGVDVKRDSLMAPWVLESGALRSPQRDAAEDDAPGSHNTFLFPLPNLPRNYDLRYRITRNARGFAVTIGFSRGDEFGDLRIDGGNGFRIFSPRMGKEKGAKNFLGVGETHYVLLEVREDRARGSLDGKMMTEKIGKLPSGPRDTAFFPSSKTTGPAVAIGVCGGSITVHSAEFRETDKDGKPVTPVLANKTTAGSTSPPTVSYAGTWRNAGASDEGLGFILKDDHTGTRLGKRSDIAGRWTVDKDGEFEFHNSDKAGHWYGKFSADGQTLMNTKTNAQLRREPPPSGTAPRP